ncbi:hypothetical protein Are01nite_59250 [Actinoplanes regularis]|nr:hypothetical protein Are01nite_59250 [Actinoplanes regularis]
MMRSLHTFRIGIAVAAIAVAAGCGAASGSSPTSAPSTAPPQAAPSDLPTITKTPKPPKEPTDNLPETGWVAGMVTQGGSGPCYGLTTDDGTRYALYNAGGITLAQNDRVRVKLESTLLRIYCGPGKLMAMVAAEPIK